MNPILAHFLTGLAVAVATAIVQYVSGYDWPSLIAAAVGA